MLCPNCDSVINAIGCQACGWKVGDAWPAFRLEPGTAHPLKSRNLYPPMTGVKTVPTVVEPERIAVPVVPVADSVDVKELVDETEKIKAELDQKLGTETVQ